jgi:hypothetical protein
VGYCVLTPLDATIDWTAAVALADKALYVAKRAGRDG